MIIDSTRQDLRHALRSFASNRTFAVLSVLCLSLAIGTHTTVFTFVNALLLRPLPLVSPEQLVSVQETRRSDPRTAGPASYPNFLDWKAQASEVAEMAAHRRVNLRVSDGGAADRYAAALVSWNFFSVLGLQPAIGRGFLEDEDSVGGAPVVLLSHILWRQRYGGDPAVVGRSITVNGVARTVVGVMPPELSHVALQRVLPASRLWIPIGPEEKDGRRGQRGLAVYARLRNGVTRQMASARLDTIARGLEEQYPLENDGWRARIEPMTIGVSATTRSMMMMAMGAVSFVLLIACANVANLTLARATGRRRDIATRLALGAPRIRIVRQLLTESLLVALASVPFGVALAYWGRALMLGADASQELSESIPIDSHVLIFTMGLAILTSVLSGLIPALHAVRRVHHDVLTIGGARHSVAGPPHPRLSHALIVGEVALSLILLVGASLFVQSFRNLLEAEGSFDTSHILSMRVEMEETGAEMPDSVSRRANEYVEHLAALPGVTHAAAANLTPLRGGGVRAVVFPGSFTGRADEAPSVLIGNVTSDFFGVLDVSILQGRTFTNVEGRSRSAVAVVNKTMAQRLWPRERAIGQRFRRATDKDGVWFTVIGVSDDILSWDLSNRPIPTAYLPYAYGPARDPRLFVRASGDPARLAQPVRTAIHSIDPTSTVLEVRTMTDIHYLALSRNQTLASLFTVLGVIALLLGATGVYGVLSYFVSQRTHEIGIRAALGADRRTLIGLFVRQGMRTTFIGVVVGLAGAWGLARVLRGRFYEVSASDPLTFAGVAVLLIGVGLLATYIPARRAAAVDPLVAIRD